jgi:hypothetical protein
MRTDDLMALFGGQDAVERLTGASHNAVNNWRSTGVPYRHWPALIREAHRCGLGLKVTFETLEATRVFAKTEVAAE